MSTITLPLEILSEIFEYNENNYATLYSCVLVNKQWHNINIPILWRNPCHSPNSTKITINCLLKEEDKDFLSKNGIELTFDLLEKPPLYNYAQFCTRLHLINSYRFQMLAKTPGLNNLRNRLIKFILDHSAAIRDFSTFNIDYCCIKNHGFNNNFRNLSKLICYSSVEIGFIDRLTNICKTIQSLVIYYSKYNNKFEDSMARLIKAQKQIKQLSIFSDIDQALSDNFKQAIFTHSQTITSYSSSEAHDLDNILLPTMYNLKTLSLTSYDIEIKYLKNISLPHLESVTLYVYNQPFLSELSDFVNNNGWKLKSLDLCAIPHDSKFLGNLFQSIAHCCKNLVDLSIVYKDKVDQELIEVLNNCTKLESIELKKVPMYSTEQIDGDRILAVLNQTLPKKLTSIIINNEIFYISDNSFDNLMKNWRGPKPFTIKFKKFSGFSDLQRLIEKYQDLGFLNKI